MNDDDAEPRCYDGSNASDEAKALAPLLQAANPFGALHIVVADHNCEDDDIRFCLLDERLTDDERQLAEGLLRLSEEQRYEAIAYADGAPVWIGVE